MLCAESPERKNGRLDQVKNGSSFYRRPLSPPSAPNLSLLAHPVAPAANSTMLCSRQGEMSSVGLHISPPSSTSSNDLIPALGCTRRDALAARNLRAPASPIPPPTSPPPPPATVRRAYRPKPKVEEEMETRTSSLTAKARVPAPAPVPAAPAPAPTATELLRTRTPVGGSRRKKPVPEPEVTNTHLKKPTTTGIGRAGTGQSALPRKQSRKRTPAQPMSSPRESDSASIDNLLYTLLVEGAKSRPDAADLSTTIQAADRKYGHRYKIESDALKSENFHFLLFT